MTRVFITNIVSQNGEPQLNCGKGKLCILGTDRRLSINNALPKNTFYGGRQQGVAPLTALGEGAAVRRLLPNGGVFPQNKREHKG